MSKQALILESWGRRQEKRRHQEQAALLRRSFRDFVRESWPTVEPAKKFLPNWHIDAIAEHLQAVANGQIQYLLINVPPGHAKSLIVSVQFPAWLWLEYPEARLLCGTYAHKLTVRDAVRSRTLITSDWYQETFRPDWTLKDDANEKDLYYNTKTGFRNSLSVTGQGTGHRGSSTILDDILSVDQAVSEAERTRACEWASGTMFSRRNDLATDWQIAIGQRLHEQDPYGEMIASGYYEHLCLPSEYEPGSTKTTSIGFHDPRTVEGELLFPALFPREVIEQSKTTLGSYKYAGQHQQRPAPLEGGLFKRSWWQRGIPPAVYDLVICSWDCAFKEAVENDYVAGFMVGFIGTQVWLLDLVKDHMGYVGTKQAIKDMIAKWSSIGIHASHKLIEDKANGSAVIQELRREIPGILEIEPEGGKFARAWSCTAEVEAGQVYIPEGAAWAGDFIASCSVFPNGAHDDDVDAFTQAMVYRRKNLHGVIQYYESQARKTMNGIAKIQIAVETPVCPECGSAAVRLLDENTGEKRCNQCGVQFGRAEELAVEYLNTHRGRLLEK